MKCARCALAVVEVVEQLVAAFDVVQTASNRLEVSSHESPVKLRGTRMHRYVRSRPITNVSNVARRDRLEIEKAATHDSHIGNSPRAGRVNQVRKYTLADDE